MYKSHQHLQSTFLHKWLTPTGIDSHFNWQDKENDYIYQYPCFSQDTNDPKKHAYMMSLVNNEDLSYICLLSLEIYIILVAKILFHDMNISSSLFSGKYNNLSLKCIIFQDIYKYNALQKHIDNYETRFKRQEQLLIYYIR